MEESALYQLIIVSMRFLIIVMETAQTDKDILFPFFTLILEREISWEKLEGTFLGKALQVGTF